MKPIKIIALICLIYSSTAFTNGRNKPYRIGDFTSNIENYSSEQFKDDIKTIILRLGSPIKSDSLKYSDNDLEISGDLRIQSSKPLRYHVFFRISKLKNDKTIEAYDDFLYINNTESLYYMLEKKIKSMKQFNTVHESETYFMPGAAIDVYQPRDTEVEDYFGPSVEFVFYSRYKSGYSNRKGPSRIKSYGKIGILNSTGDSPDMLLLNTGVNLSFESNTNRNFLLPYFGSDIGGLYGKNLSTLHFTPHLGIELFSNSNIIFCVQAGYLYSVRKFDQYSGFNFKSSLNILLW